MVRKTQYEYNIIYKNKHPERFKASKKADHLKHKDHYLEYYKKYRLDHKYKEERKPTLKRKLEVGIRCRLYTALKNNFKLNATVISDLGCSIPELKSYLESLWQPGMSWDNWSMNGWHIDHIKPLASFDLTNREQFLQACHYTNLQPLWAKDNLSKSDKYSLDL